MNQRVDTMVTRRNASPTRGKAGFTLVELLVVLFLLMLLAAIALPQVRKIISDQLTSRTARGIQSYIDVARNRAITEGRQVGVLIERAGPYTDLRGRAHAIRIRQLTDVPPYTGDATNSVALVQRNVVPPGPAMPAMTAEFNPVDNQLLTLSASMVSSGATDADDPQAPIRNGDYIEFPGGRLVPFTMRYRALTEPDTTPVTIDFNMNEILDGSRLFPSSVKPIPTDRPIKFKIHRQPVVSTVAPYTLPRGMAIDLNYSGLGVSGNQFAPTTISPNIAIIFGPDGQVIKVTEIDYSTSPNSARVVPPTGQIFLCLGDADGIRSDNLFAQEKKATASLLNLKSNWIVINPSSGRVSAAPFSPVGSIPAGVVTDPTDASLGVAIVEARLLANLSDTVDQE